MQNDGKFSGEKKKKDTRRNIFKEEIFYPSGRLCVAIYLYIFKEVSQK